MASITKQSKCWISNVKICNCRHDDSHGLCKDIQRFSAKQKLFVPEYLVDLNASGAARRSKYSEKTCHTIGNENIRKPQIIAALQCYKSKLAEKESILSPEQILEGYTRNATLSMKDFYDEGGGLIPPHMLSDEAAMVVTETKHDKDGLLIGYKIQDKKGNLDSLARTYAMFTDKKELSGPGGKPVDLGITVEYKGVEE